MALYTGMIHSETDKAFVTAMNKAQRLNLGEEDTSFALFLFREGFKRDHFLQVSFLMPGFVEPGSPYGAVTKFAPDEGVYADFSGNKLVVLFARNQFRV